MKLFRFFPIVIFLLSSCIIDAQMPRHRKSQETIIGWADDSHYVVSTSNSFGKSEIRKVEVKSGKYVLLNSFPSGGEELFKSLPSGTYFSFKDVISPDEQAMVKAQYSDLFYFHIGDKDLKRLTNDTIPEINATFSPDGKKIAYTKNKDLYVYDLGTNREIRLTTDASEKIYNGYASWVYMEEILGRASKYAAFWWSPDGSRLAYLRTDDADVPVFTLNRADETAGIHGRVEATPYPKAGDPNPKVKMGIADISTGKTTWVKTDYNTDQYIAWPFWTPDSRKLAVQVVNRDQNDIKIILADPATGDFTEIYDESRKTWVDFFQDIYVMDNGSGFIVRSYRTDWENLYYYAWDGKLIRQVTNLDFRITEINKVDEVSKTIYFYATGKESTDKHLFRVGLDGKNLVQITSGSGNHEVNISPGGSWFIDTWSNIQSPGSTVVIDKNGKQVREVSKAASSGLTDSPKQELFRITTSDGLFDMPALITYPENFDPAYKYPVVFTVYGGPGDQNITNEWMGDQPDWYSKNGIISFMVDHRGSGHFGRKGTDFLYRNLGKWEISDYEDAVKWLRKQAFVDSSRMGITGSSYGGYMTCLALTKGAGFWTHGIAGSSVTDWRLYDDIYTERFMDTPQDNPEGYRESSPLTFAKNLKGKLLITHGDMDDNVHMQNSLYLISKLQDQGTPFEFMIYPGQRHGWGGAKAVFLRNEEHNFWKNNFFHDKNKD